MSSSADICQKIEAACAKCEQERLAAEAEEAAMLKEMEERLEEEKQMEEVRIAMEIEKRESERNQRRIQKEKQRAEKRRRQEEEEDVPVVVKWVRRMVRWRMSHKQRRQEAELGPAGTAGLLSYDFPGSFRNRKYAGDNSGQERTKSGTLPVTDKDLASTYVLCHLSPTCP